MLFSNTVICRLLSSGVVLVLFVGCGPTPEELIEQLLGSWAGEDEYAEWCLNYRIEDEDKYVLEFYQLWKPTDGLIHKKGYFSAGRGGRFSHFLATVYSGKGRYIPADSDGNRPFQPRKNYLLLEWDGTSKVHTAIGEEISEKSYTSQFVENCDSHKIRLLDKYGPPPTENNGVTNELSGQESSSVVIDAVENDSKENSLEK